MTSSPLRRIALLSLHSSPLAAPGKGADVGGMNLYVLRLAEGLADEGFHVDMFTRRTDPQAAEIVPVSSRARLIHLAAGPARRLPKNVLPMHLNSMVASFEGFMHRQGIRYDILHSHYWLSGLAAMRYRVRTGVDVPFVTMFHTLHELKRLYSGTADRSDSALRFDGERCIIGRADAIVGATDAERQDMVRLYGRSPARYVTIPPGVDLARFRPLGHAASRRTLGLDAERVVLFVGRQDPLKGVDILLRSVAALPDRLRRGLKLLLVGDQPGSKLRRLATRLGLGDTILVCGRVGQDELPIYYSAADVCAMPSSYESFGMAAVEAMACQTPVVAFGVGGLLTTITDGQTGFLVPHGDYPAYARVLTQALESSELDVMGRRARLSIQRYSWQAVTARSLELYDDLLDEYAGSRRLSVV
ncbi:MAG TPA: glycosyltransferase [Chloroflexota bacterium]|nr:glycosyltransferase [Chloroflexota bacterium]